MLSELKIILEGEDLSFRKSSNFQGVLMEMIDGTVAEELHSNSLNPYSQSIEKEGENCIWRIRALNEKAHANIIMPIFDGDFERIQLKDREVPVLLRQKTLKKESKKTLMDEFYHGTSERYINIEFLTPTAFKQNGRYVFYPDIRMIYSNLMNRYSKSSEEIEMYDEEMLEDLVKNTELVHYHLKSCKFPLEGISIPGFMGRISLKLHGNQTMKNYIKLLFRFSEYAGIGIKTSMGMGSVRLYALRDSYL